MVKKHIAKIVCILISMFFFCVVGYSNVSTLAEDANKVINEKLLPIMTSSNEMLNIYYYDLGTHKNGDSYIITIGDTQILVDAGADKSSEQHIIQNMKYLLEKDSKGAWEYIIFTHPHEDHIVNAAAVLDFFIDNNGKYYVENIIDFDYAKSLPNLVSEKDTNVDEDDTSEESLSLLSQYRKKRDAIANLDNAEYNYFSAEDLSGKDKNKTFILDDNAKLSMLYNYYYDNECTNSNNLSVCFMITYGNQKMLFTGDLETTGEKKLMEYNKDNINFENLTFFKASHHGSRTANSQEFIDIIRPAYVAISASADTTEYNFNPENRFPSQTAMHNFFKYTDHIYITNREVIDENGKKSYKPYFGNVLFQFDGENTQVYSTNNCDENSLAKNIYETEWFIDNRQESAYIYTFDEPINSYANCTLIKYGHYDIVIDSGSTEFNSYYFVDELKKYCTDGILEYVILTHAHYANFNNMVGNKSNKGIIDVFKIENIIDFGSATTMEFAMNSGNGIFSEYKEFLKENKNNYSSITDNNGYLNQKIIENKLSFEVIGNYGMDFHTEDAYSMTIIFNYYKEKFIFVGDLYDYSKLVENYSNNIKSARFFRTSNSYGFESNYKEFLDLISSKSDEDDRLYTVIGTSLNYSNSSASVFGGIDYCNLLLSNLKKGTDLSYIYPTSYIDSSNNYNRINGTICFECIYEGKQYTRCSLKGENGKANLLENTQYYKELVKEQNIN